MKPVTSHAAFFIGAGQAEPPRNRGDGLMEGGIENRHLRQIRTRSHGGMRGRQIVRLMKRGERVEAFKLIHHLRVQHHRLGEQVSAMHHTMSGADQSIRAEMSVAEIEHRMQKRLVRKSGSIRPNLVFHNLAICTASRQMRRLSQALHLSTGEDAQIFRTSARVGLEQCELQAGGAGVQGQDRIGHYLMLAWVSRARVISTATAQEAMRVSGESARLVRMIGTRAPSTTPAASAPAR